MTLPAWFRVLAWCGAPWVPAPEGRAAARRVFQRIRAGGPVCPLYRGAGRRGEQGLCWEVSFGQDLKEPMFAGQRARGSEAFGPKQDCAQPSVGSSLSLGAVEARHLGVSRGLRTTG